MEALLRLAAEAASRRNGGSLNGTEVVVDTENPQPNEEELHA